MLAKAYRVETERLVIRCYQPLDAALLKAAIDESLDHLRPWMPWAVHEPEPLEAKQGRMRKYRGQFDLGQDYVFGVFSKNEEIQIGSTGLHNRLEDEAREIGYWIRASYAGQGYATESTRALIKVGFEIEQLERIEIRCASNNLASQQVPRKLGFIHEATLRDRTVDPEGQPRDVMIWTLFKEDYLNSSLPETRIKAYGFSGDEIKMG